MVMDYSQPWAVCDICKPYLERRQLHLLLRRSAWGMLNGRLLNAPELAQQRHLMKKTYEQLFKAGLGRPVPLDNPNEPSGQDKV
jgi:hypothetical protein